MTIERVNNEIIFRVSGDIAVDDLQDIADLLEFRELAKDSKAVQNDVNQLVKTVKAGRWKKTEKKLSR
ncbi:MAG: hypothetical protein WBA23_20430 [Tunicatimonas sp.]|uniref:hypothetical protein n=1 Tax=Tunicatimonas sp. TaxID=1940096 RepID=UPI003C777989